MAAESGGHDSGAIVDGVKPSLISLSEFLAQRGLSKYAASFEADEVDLEAFVLLQDADMKRWASSASEQTMLAEACREARVEFPELELRDQRIESFDSQNSEEAGSDDIDLSVTLPKDFKFERQGQKSLPRNIRELRDNSGRCDSGIDADGRVGSPSSPSNLTAMKKLGNSEPNLAPDSSTKAAGLDSGTSTAMSRKRSIKSRAGRPRSMVFSTENPERGPGGLQSPEHCSSPLPMNVIQALQANSRSARRWSFASSIPSCSSGYDSSSPASWSSHERLHQLPQRPTSDEMQGLIRLFGTGEEGEDFLYRSRSRSLSPSRAPYNYMDMSSLNHVFRDRFPKAKEQMEDKLKEFLQEAEAEISANQNDAAFIFAVHQLEELARNILTQSQLGKLSNELFRDATSNLDRLYNELCVKRDSSEDTNIGIHKLAHHLLTIFARPARLLECLEFDADTFYHEEVSDIHADMNEKLSSLNTMYNVPQYIQQQLRQLEEGSSLDKSGRCFSPVQQLSRSSSPTHEELEKTDLPKEEDFDCVKLISQGAYSSVHLVRHAQSNKLFAMKKVSKLNMVRKKQVDQVFCERDILTFAENPFVVAMICTFETKRHLCMVLEYVEGGDCATLLKNMQGPLPLELARMYFAETVLALEYLHSYGIVHCDLKPDNMLITSEGHIKLTDFGLSKVGLMSFTTTMFEGGFSKAQMFNDDQVYGTPDYIAPEVILRKGYGAPVDWWAMGIILYEFLIGITPFFGEGDADDLFDRITSEEEEPEFTDEISEEAHDIILQLLQRNPADRLGSHGFGAREVKEHPFFDHINWRTLLLQKAEFVPHLDNEEDTSYFDPRTDRYNHTLEDDDETDGMEMTNTFQGFATTSMRYHQINSPMGSRHPSTTNLPEMGLDSPSPRRTSKQRRKSSFTSGSLNLSSPRSSSLLVSETLESPSTPEVLVQPATPNETPIMTSPVSSSSPSPIQMSKQYQEAVRKPSKLHFEHQEPEETFSSPPHSAGHSTGVSFNSLVSSAGSGHGQGSVALTKTGAALAGMGHDLWAFGSPRPGPQAASYTVEKGRHGYGMSLRAIRVYLGDTDKYCVQHLVRDVDMGSPAWNAGIRPDHLITHIDDVPVAGLKHTDVSQLLFAAGKTRVTFQMVHLNETSITTGGRKRLQSMGRRLSSKQEMNVKKMMRSGSLGRRKGKGFFSRHGSRKRKESTGRPGSPSHRSSSPGSQSPLTTHTSVMSQSSPTLSRGPIVSTLTRIARKIKPDRRRSVSSIPVSPLARGPSPSGSTVGSPTSNSPPLQRASSPHVHSAVPPAVVAQHSPLRKTLSASGVPTNSSPLHTSHRPVSLTHPPTTDIPTANPRSGSPLLRRALSPDHSPGPASSPPDPSQSFSPPEPSVLTSPKRSLRHAATASSMPTGPMSPARKVKSVRKSMDETSWSERTRQFDSL